MVRGVIQRAIPFPRPRRNGKRMRAFCAWTRAHDLDIGIAGVALSLILLATTMI